MSRQCKHVWNEIKQRCLISIRCTSFNINFLKVKWNRWMCIIGAKMNVNVRQRETYVSFANILRWIYMQMVSNLGQWHYCCGHWCLVPQSTRVTVPRECVWAHSACTLLIKSKHSWCPHEPQQTTWKDGFDTEDCGELSIPWHKKDWLKISQMLPLNFFYF